MASSQPEFTGGLTLAFQVKDRAKSIQWYQEMLGFKLLYDLDDLGWCEMSTATPGVNVGLSQVEQPRNGGLVPTFGVKDIAAERQRLEAMDVRFDGDTQVIPEMVKLATFFDPDGNALMLFESLMEQPA